ncbi:MAG: hypothetical protein AAGI03_05185 [Pseudomonadota bacterium]
MRPGFPDHPDRVNIARWLAIARGTLTVLPKAGSLPHYRAKALHFCETYGLDPAAEQADAETYAERARRWEADGTEPPGEIEW